MKDAPLSDMLRQAIIETEKILWPYLILVVKIIQTLAEVQEHIFNQGVPIDHDIPVLVPVAQSSSTPK